MTIYEVLVRQTKISDFANKVPVKQDVPCSQISMNDLQEDMGFQSKKKILILNKDIQGLF